MSTEENKAVVRRSIEAFNARDLSAGNVHSEDLRRDLQQYVDTMPWGDHQVDITEMIAEGDRVVALIATQGVHSGGVPRNAAHWQALHESGRRGVSHPGRGESPRWTRTWTP